MQLVQFPHRDAKDVHHLHGKRPTRSADWRLRKHRVLARNLQKGNSSFLNRFEQQFIQEFKISGFLVCSVARSLCRLRHSAALFALSVYRIRSVSLHISFSRSSLRFPFSPPLPTLSRSVCVFLYLTPFLFLSSSHTHKRTHTHLFKFENCLKKDNAQTSIPIQTTNFFYGNFDKVYYREQKFGSSAPICSVCIARTVKVSVHRRENFAPNIHFVRF